MKRLLALVVTCCAPVFTQQNVPPDPATQLQRFLQLTDKQLETILANNDEHNQWYFQKQARVFDLQREIDSETTKEVLDPMALGVRYAEMETICREYQSRAQQDRTRNTAILTADQKARLKVLEDARSLESTISAAQNLNVLDSPNGPSSFIGQTSGGFINGGFLTRVGGPPGCYYRSPTLANTASSAQASRQDSRRTGPARPPTTVR
ncbi:MAG: hypothetical protein U0Q16_27165 [Bryobacteraceae bacterium]